jgi:hypothetical protein
MSIGSWVWSKGVYTKSWGGFKDPKRVSKSCFSFLSYLGNVGEKDKIVTGVGY